MTNSFNSSDAAREFITLPTLQDKEAFFRAIKSENQLVLVQRLKSYAEQEHHSAEAKAAFYWLYEISSALYKSSENDLENVKQRGLTSGFLQKPNKLVEVFTVSARQALEVWDVLGSERINLALQITLLSWLPENKERNVQLESLIQPASKYGLINDQKLPKALHAIHSDIALIQMLTPVTTQEALQILVTHEVRRFIAHKLPFFAIALGASYAMLIAQTNEAAAKNLLTQCLNLVRNNPGTEIEHISLLHLLQIYTDFADRKSIVAELDQLIADYISSLPSEKTPASYLRLFASVMIENAVFKQETDQQNAAFNDYTSIIEMLELASMVDPINSNFNDKLNLATAFMNRGNVRRALKPVDNEAALTDYFAGVEMKEDLLGLAHGEKKLRVMSDLTIGYRNIVNALSGTKPHDINTADAPNSLSQKSLTPPKKSIGTWINRLVDLLESLSLQTDDLRSVQWKHELATALITRAEFNDRNHRNARMVTPTPEWVDQAKESCFKDLDTAIELLQSLMNQGVMKAALRTDFAWAHAMRARVLDAKCSTDTVEALKHLEIAIGIWRNSDQSPKDTAFWLEACTKKVKLLASQDQLEEALLFGQSILDERFSLLNETMDLKLREALLTGGDNLPQTVAIILNRLDRPMEALEIIYKHLGLRQSLGKESAVSVKPLPLTSLTPKGGAIVVPVVTEGVTTLFILDGDGNLETLEFGYWIDNNTKVMSLMTLVASDNLLKGEDTATNLHLLDRSLSIAMDLIWRQFVEPIWKVLNEKMLIPHDSPITFVTQGILDYLPLHAAARKVKGQWRFAIEDRVIRYAPTLQALNTMKAQASTHRCEPRIAGFFDPLGDLPSSRGIELRELASIGTPSNIAYWVGDKASRNQFLKTLENWDELIYSDLHVSTHSEFCLDRPESSYLVFSSEEHEESHITAAEIFGLPPLSSLNHVCLASCVSGRSDIGKSSGEPRNLVAAFLHIGASSVLSSLYPLIDRPAANLISSIYKRRASGDELAEAIRNEICERLIIARQKGHSVICLDENAPSSETSGPYINEQINGWYENQGVLPLSWWAGLKPTCPG